MQLGDLRFRFEDTGPRSGSERSQLRGRKGKHGRRGLTTLPVNHITLHILVVIAILI